VKPRLARDEVRLVSLTSGLLTITGQRLDAPAPRSRLMPPSFVTFIIKGHCDLTPTRSDALRIGSAD
jgi:hypothetical protein